MCSGSDDWALPQTGFPIRKSAGQRLFSASPRLIAAVRVLHRLLVPRHPPCALTILTEEHHILPLCRFQGAREALLRSKKPRTRRGLSKLSSVRRSSTMKLDRCQVDVFQVARTVKWKEIQDLTSLRPVCSRPAVCEHRHVPRKEVIQPHLPVRLPCYDFTPITKPTFDGSLPCGLGHRLRVFPAFVV